MFSNIMNDIYACGGVTKDIVSCAIATELFRQGITAEKIKEDLKSMDAYEQNKRLSISLLSLYEASSKDDSGKVKTSYDQAYTILSSFSEAFSLDHLLVQTPDPASTSFMYYKNESLNSLVLKAGNDFPSEIANGMDYDTFTRKVLNQIGNLRIYYKDKNSGRQNTSIELKEYDNFTKYQNIVDRGTDLIDVLVDFCLPDPEIDASQLQAINSKKSEANLPKMDKLIEFGLIKPGDKIYYRKFR